VIDLYLWTTPNGRKPLILLEELGLEYRKIAVDLRRGEQHSEEFRRVNPNGKIPALIDRRGPNEIRVFESGAILIYLAESAGQFLPEAGQARADTLSWLMFQMGGVGPMFGQLGHFKRADEQVPYAIQRYTEETRRLLGVLERRFGDVEYIAGDYSIADMATFPWVQALDFLKMPLDDFPRVRRWAETIATRPAVERAMSVKLA
jgi:GSH-dependent disulfide-bond oxidoreductase